MTLLQKINNLTWFDLINKLKSILLDLAGQSGGGIQSITGDYVDSTDPLNIILNDPRPYKVYTALLTQSGGDAPVARVLENTLGGEVVWGYSDLGEYIAQTNGLFIGHVGVFSQDTNVSFRRIIKVNTNLVVLTTFDPTGVPTDGLLTDSLIEIRVYN